MEAKIAHEVAAKYKLRKPRVGKNCVLECNKKIKARVEKAISEIRAQYGEVEEKVLNEHTPKNLGFLFDINDVKENYLKNIIDSHLKKKKINDFVEVKIDYEDKTIAIKGLKVFIDDVKDHISSICS